MQIYRFDWNHMVPSWNYIVPTWNYIVSTWNYRVSQKKVGISQLLRVEKTISKFCDAECEIIFFENPILRYFKIRKCRFTGLIGTIWFQVGTIQFQVGTIQFQVRTTLFHYGTIWFQNKCRQCSDMSRYSLDQCR